MIFKRSFITITFISCSGLLFSQKNREAAGTDMTISPSTILKSSTVLTENPQVPIELTNAHYDPARSNFPYFLDSKRISKKASVTATLKNVQSVELSPQVSQKIMSLFGTNINSQFQTTLTYGQNGLDQIAYLTITPYRVNSNGLVEELISYQTNWDVGAANVTSQKTASVTPTWKTNSVLSSGTWYKIGVTRTGMYKIDATFLQNAGINVSGLNPKNIRVYGNGGHMLPQQNSIFRYDDLQENAIEVVGESDGVFDPNDLIVFYGIGPDEWKYDPKHNNSCLTFDHQVNYYSDTSYYFINVDLGGGKRITNKSSISAAPTGVVTTYDYYDFHELNAVNFIKSGRHFYGENFDVVTGYSFGYSIPNLVQGDTINSAVSFAARGQNNSVFSINFSGNTSTLSVSAVNVNDYLGDYVAIGTICSKVLSNSSAGITYNLNKLSSTTVGWLDYIEFNCRRNLTFNGSQFGFRDSRTTKSNVRNATKFVLNNTTGNGMAIWDVTDPVSAEYVLVNTNANLLDFTLTTDSLREFVAFNGSDYMNPRFIKKIGNQNLHGVAQADFVVVTHPDFIDHANRLAALHAVQDSLTISVVTTEQVYNEFSSGRPDIVGIRDYVRMLYARNLSAGKEVKYLLLLGDGSYKVKDRYASENTSFVPVYESEDSYRPTLSTVTDDFFGWMDDNEGDDWSGGLVDVGVGRFPVKTVQEASDAVSKVEAYYKKNYNFSLVESETTCGNTTSCYPQGDWRNWVCFVADDEDYQTHMSDADKIAKSVKLKHPEYNLDKIFADAYIQYTTPGGQRYPDVSSGLDHRITKGCLVFNYTGHGGEVGLGHERYLELSQIQGYNNLCNLPLFVTATCEFSRFDDPERTSAGELCFLNPNGAAIALLTTVRLAFSNTNLVLNQNLYDYIFDPLPSGKMPHLGDICKLTKQKSGISFYYLNFHLLGDPALRLAYPDFNVETSSINGKPVTTATDTLKALQKITIKGFVGVKTGTVTTKLNNFNGVLYPTVFDKEQTITCLGNDPGSLAGGQPFQFQLQKNIIYKGKVQVTNGDFSFSFIVPKDISYNFDYGKISYYAHNGINDARGYNGNFYLGGSVNNAIADNNGPSIGLYLNDKKFVSGGTTSEKPGLYAELADSSGINTVGSGIGHDISAILDENSSKPIVLNDYYEADLNSYQKGKVKYQFDALPEGNHRLSLKVWDVQNNSATAYTDFVVAPSAEMALTHVLNYPNPFTSRTKFFFESNKCCHELKVNIQVFTISGKVVKTISLDIKNTGFRSDGIDWDGKDDYGDRLAKGVYIYKVSVFDMDSKKAEKTEKLVILN